MRRRQEKEEIGLRDMPAPRGAPRNGIPAPPLPLPLTFRRNGARRKFPRVSASTRVYPVIVPRGLAETGGCRLETRSTLQEASKARARKPGNGFPR